jgi:hypothetical protein
MTGESNQGGYVSQREFDRTLALLEEIRQDIKGDVADLSKQLEGTTVEITRRQDVANGRTSKNEIAVISAAEHLAAVANQLQAVQVTVSTIERDGCKQQKQHGRMVAALAMAGIVPETGEVPLDGIEAPAGGWRKHGEKGVWAGVGAGFTLLVPHLLTWAHWLVHQITRQPLP